MKIETLVDCGVYPFGGAVVEQVVDQKQQEHSCLVLQGFSTQEALAF
jgi:hypothetical protein